MSVETFTCDNCGKAIRKWCNGWTHVSLSDPEDTDRYHSNCLMSATPTEQRTATESAELYDQLKERATAYVRKSLGNNANGVDMTPFEIGVAGTLNWMLWTALSSGAQFHMHKTITAISNYKEVEEPVQDGTL